MSKRKLNTFTDNFPVLHFGDFILFQEYKQQRWNTKHESYDYTVSSPIMVIYLGWKACDQTVGFSYLPWQNANRESKEIFIYSHVEWSDYIDILDIWKCKPTWKEIIKAWRTQNTRIIIPSSEISWNR